jgi:hypothetical protein
MLIPNDRRATDRRRKTRLAVQKVKKSERRADERRDTPRVRRMLRVIDPSTGTDFRTVAVLSLEGATWRSPVTPSADRVEVHLSLPDIRTPQAVTARITGTQSVGDAVKVSAIFENVDVRLQLAIARYLEQRVKMLTLDD